MREAISIPGPEGILEALLEMPRELSGRGLAVVCHPHPRHHGTMLNKVVHTICRAMNELGLPAVRFNFRGVGASEGSYADGHGEIEDVLAVAAWARAREPELPIWLAGFSFGAGVCARAAAKIRPAQLIAVAPPATRLGPDLSGLMPACPWLVIQGDADEVVSCDAVRAWVAGLSPAPNLVVLPGVDHFFHGRLTLLRQTLLEHLADADSG